MILNRKKNKIRNLPRRLPTGKTKDLFGKVLYWLCLGFFVGAIFYVLFFSPWTKISEVSVFGNETLEMSIIQEAVKGEMRGKYFNWLEKNNYLLIKEDKLENNLVERFKKIKKVEVKKKFPDRLEISMEERKEFLVFCGGEKCFLLDEWGRVLSEISQEKFSELGENLTILKSEKSRELKVQDLVLGEGFSQYILEIKTELKNRLALEAGKEVFTPQLISGDLRFKTEEGWLVYFDKNIPVEKEIKMLETFLAEKLKDIPRENLEYIDLRSDKKIYYKLKKIEEEKKTEKEIRSEAKGSDT